MASAANRLGFSTQVPAKASYATTGRTRTKRAGGRSLTLKHSRAPVLDNASDAANTVLQALAHLGKDSVDDDKVRYFAARSTTIMKRLVQARPEMPGWWGTSHSRSKLRVMDEFARRTAAYQRAFVAESATRRDLTAIIIEEDLVGGLGGIEAIINA